MAKTSAIERNLKRVRLSKKYFKKSNFRKISLKHIIEISTARIDEIASILFNKNKNLEHNENKKNLVYLEVCDNNIAEKFKDYFERSFKNCKLEFYSTFKEDSFRSIKILSDLLSKGWTKEAIPITNKKRSWISRVFSGLFE